MPRNNPALQKAIKAVGSQVALAEAMTSAGRDTTQQAVSWWLTKGNLPPDACVVIERLTGVRCEELCDDYEFIRVNDRIYHHRVGQRAA